MKDFITKFANGEYKKVAVEDYSKLTNSEILQIVTCQDLGTIEWLSKDFASSLTPLDFLDLFLINKQLHKDLENHMWILVKKCQDLNYDSELDTDGYPIGMERDVLLMVEQYCINNLNWHEEWWSNR